MPKVSVIIPTYNRADMLPKAIESALAQTYTDFELIIVDDGSSDQTGELVSRMAASASCPVRYVYQENRGEPAARNHGIALAQGEYIAFLDSDDTWLPPHLEACVDALDSHPGVGAVFTDHGITRDGESYVPTVARAGKSPHELLLNLTCRELILASDAVMIRRFVFSEVGHFNETLHVGTDWEMWVRIAAHYEMLHVPRLTVIVLQHASNTAALPRKIEENIARAVEAIMAYATPEMRAVQRKLVARHHLDIGYFYAMAGDRRLAASRLARAVVSDRRVLRSSEFTVALVRLVTGRATFERLRKLRHTHHSLPVPAG